MMLVPTHVRASGIHGVGLFTQKPIRRGYIVWAYDGRLDRIITRGEFDGLPQAARDFIVMYATLRPFGWHLCGDNARFINHSTAPNLEYEAFGRVLAVRDIAADEELTENYVSLGEVGPNPCIPDCHAAGAPI